MQKFYYPNFDPHLTLLGGQAFNWINEGENFYGIFESRVLKIKYNSNYLYWESSLGDDDFLFVENLFDKDLEYEGVLCEITKDESVKKAVAQFPGLRILKQPFEQTLISFVISQNSNIPKIKSSLNKLSKLVKRKVIFDSKEFDLFPSISEISNLSIEDLTSTGIGYRAKYLNKISTELVYKAKINDEFSYNKFLRNELSKMTLMESRELLISLHGIGPKVADCILVFGLGFREVTPLDLWAKRAFTQTYRLPQKICYKDLLEFVQAKFGKNTAYAGQFLFEYFRINKIK